MVSRRMRSVACGKQRAGGGQGGSRARVGLGGGRQVGCGPARLVATWPRLTPLITVLPTAAQPSPLRYHHTEACYGAAPRSLCAAFSASLKASFGV